jgi:ribonuclease BN (tRNA processing enzyme)
MSGLRLLCLGVGDAFSALYYSTCFALEAQAQWLLVDCPHPLRKIFYEGAQAAGLELDVDKIGALALTHLHSDHVSGVEGLAYYFHYVLGRKLTVITHPDIAADLWPKHLAAGMEWSIEAAGQPPVRRTPDEFLDIVTLEENQTVRHGPFALSCRKATHSVPTIALLVSAAGRTLGYSADTALDRSLVNWLAQADRIVHDAGGGFMHTAYEELLALPAEVRAKMLLAHYADMFPTQTSAIEPLYQGQIYDV